MANLSEPSSSLSFTSSSYLSNGGSSPPQLGQPPTTTTTNLEIISLSKLSCNLERLLIDSDFDCTDADVAVDGVNVGVHRCILAARSAFFKELFGQKKDGEKRPKYVMEELLPSRGKVGREAFMVFLGYLYTGKLKPSPHEVSTCVDPSCAHDACRPAVNFAVELMYASSVFQIPELVSLFQRRLLNFVEKSLVEDVIPILLVAFHSQLNQLYSRCVQRVARSDLNNVSLEKELPHEVVEEIKLIRKKSQTNSSDVNSLDPLLEKRIRRIHRALDSDDVELVKLLLTESEVTLDDATALHYAVAYCVSKVVTDVLDLGLANVNLKNNRGYTPLHVAARRREPAIIVALLTKGASAAEMTNDGQSAVSICRRLTRAKDYDAMTAQGQESNKDKLCIDILEREIMRNPTVGDESVTSPLLTDDVYAKLLYLENRVAFARLFFPAEAKVAMKIAQAEATSEFAGIESISKLREVDLNETPTVQNKTNSQSVSILISQNTFFLKHILFCDVMDSLNEEVEEYEWREVILPSLIPVVPEPELERETGQRRRGRHLLVAVDHGPNSKHAFDWAVAHLCRLADTIHLIHAVSSVKNEVVYESSKALMEELSVEAYKVTLVKTVARIVEGDAGKAICREADKLKPAAVIMGTRGRSLFQSVLHGSVSEYCFHNCKYAPVIIVPGKDAGEESVI